MPETEHEPASIDSDRAEDAAFIKAFSELGVACAARRAIQGMGPRQSLRQGNLDALLTAIDLFAISDMAIASNGGRIVASNETIVDTLRATVIRAAGGVIHEDYAAERVGDAEDMGRVIFRRAPPEQPGA
jgi:hypothetical protein